MRNWKRAMAVAMAATMVMGSSSLVLAEDMNTEGTGTGTGSVEGSVSTDVFQVVVPTDAGTAFNFTLDPEGLIAKTNEAAHGGGDKYQDDATVFFANTGADGNQTYSNTSDTITLTNKGTKLAKVTLNASMTDIDDITMATSDTFADDAVSLYLAVVDENDDSTAIDADGEEITAVISAAPEGAYEYKYDSDNTAYAYELKGDLTGITFDEYSFKLTGACNSGADWSELTDAAPVVTVTWEVEAYEAQGTAAVFTAGSNVGEITYVNGTQDMEIDEIVSITMTNVGGTFDGYNALEGAWEGALDEDETIVLNGVFVGFFNEAGTGTCDATVTYKTALGQTVTMVVEDVLVAEP